jgi:hypothetical protein
MDMGVIFKFSVVGMEHGMSADPSLQLWIAARKTIDGLPSSLLISNKAPQAPWNVTNARPS